MTVWRVVFMASVLAGCASTSSSVPRIGQTYYQPREANGDGYGYAQTRINERVFEVYFAAVTDGDAHEGVMRRSAEVTLQSGFDGFLIVSTDDKGEDMIKRRFIVGRVHRRKPTSIITISMLRRSEFEGAPSMVYDARLVLPPSTMPSVAHQGPSVQ